MKTSQLIAQLQEIATTVPFDADVVMGDDGQNTPINRVYHQPPHTFIELTPGEHENITKQTDTLIRSFLATVLTSHQAGELSLHQATDAMMELVDTVNEQGPRAVVEHIREVEQHGFDGRG